jgi:hypothetical protein
MGIFDNKKKEIKQNEITEQPNDVFLTREQILNCSDLEDIEIVDVPEWGGKVRVKALSGKERDKYETSLMEFDSKAKKVIYKAENVKARLAAYSIVDENGTRMFSDKDILTLGNKSAKALNRVVDVCRRKSGITDDDMADLEKNSEATTTEDSPTD